jgi:serine/threonine protein kinase
MSQEQWKTNWKQICELGEGGQGTTYKVESLRDPSKTGVLKLLKNDGNQQARARMAHEAINLEALAKERVKVPNLLDHNTQCHADISVRLHLIMELVPGETLDKVVVSKGGHLTLGQAIAIACDLCKTMTAMHEQGVLHRDLKPANLMIRDFEKTDLVVLDFGLSFDRERMQERLTRTGETIKNELLALPEATTPTGDRRDARSDITNIVAVFFYCLTGHLAGFLRDERDLAPHKRNGLTMEKVLGASRRTKQIEYLLDCGFAPDIENRFQTIKELKDRLSLILNPPEAKKKDPVQVAAEVGARLRRSDRALQLQEYQASAQKVFSSIQMHVNTIAARLEPFMLSYAGMSGNAIKPIGIDPVLDNPTALIVGMRGRQYSRIIKFFIGAKGDRCVLFSLTEIILANNGFLVSPNQKNQGNLGMLQRQDWNQIAWFDPMNLPSQDEIADWVNELVSMAIEQFEEEPVQTASETT